jgi:DNA (cytosine-5)-methyltransferase 1
MIELKNSTKKKLINYKFIDLFAGIGGFRMALESFGGKCVFSSEWDKHCQSVYEMNFKEKCDGDIMEISEIDIPSHDILCAGFPCQAFSISGKQRGFEDSRGTLFFEIVRIVKHHKPRLLILENVKNLERHDNGNTLKTILSILDEVGYIVKYKVLNASLFGIPQSRKRIFIIAVLKKHSKQFNNYDIPEGNGKKSSLGDLILPNSKIEERCFYNNIDLNIYKDNDNKIKPDMFDIYGQKPIRLGIVNNGGQGERIYSIKGHAITLSAYGGGVFSKTGGYLIDGKVRKLNPRECARLTGFPNSFVLQENINQCWKQFGNSVVVDVVQEIILSLIKKKII